MAEPNRSAPARGAGQMGATVVGDAGKTYVAPADPGATQHMGATHIADDGKTVVPSAEASGSAPVPAASNAGTAFTGDAGERFGDYEIVKKLGQGGMGAVYLAKQVSLDRKVALKTMTKELASRPDFVNRFLREARSMAKVMHPNVVQIYAADQIAGQYFAAIEFIDGQSMQKWMDQLGKLSIGDALHVTLVCCEALKHAHDQSMIHRDIKPDNILVTQKGVIKVADFGLAKATDEDVSMTQSGTGLGTPLYMAPEQARNAKHVDQRTDIYALGCMLYYFVTGKLPFSGTNTLELIMAKEQGRYQPPRRLNPEVPERLDLMIGKMIEKDAKNRYGSCAEVIRDLSGLGLASDSLSFIAAPDKAVLGRSSVSAASQAPVKPAPAAPRSSAEDAARKQAETASATADKVYLVQFTDKAGKMQIKKLTVLQIQQGIRGGMLDLKAKAKTSAKGDFLPLAQFREFADLLQKKAVAAKAESRGANLKAEFAKIDKQYQRRGLHRWLRNMLTNVKGIVSLVIYLAVIAGVVWGGWTYGWPLVRSKLIGGEAQTAPQTAAPQTPANP